jgi:hypothetical protein
LVDSELSQTGYWEHIVRSAHISFPARTDCPATYWKLFCKVTHTSSVELLFGFETDPEKVKNSQGVAKDVDLLVEHS